MTGEKFSFSALLARSGKRLGQRSSGASRCAALLAACTALSTTGCYRATFIEPNGRAGVVHEEWTDFFLFGLVGDADFDVRDFCAAEPVKLRTGGNFGTGVVAIVTLGIYTPRKVYITCDASDPGNKPAADTEAEQ